MQRVCVVITITVLFAGTLGSGWVHGRMANRWGQDAMLRHAADRMSKGPPRRLGPWRLVKTHQAEAGVIELLQCAAYLHAAYTNDQTGDTVVVAIVGGPAGPVSVHAPEMCYSATDYEIVGDQKQITVTDREGTLHRLWQLHAKSPHAFKPNLRVIYAWNSGRGWQASTVPRLAYAGLPVLYNLQLVGPPNDNTIPGNPDPCHEFLAHFLARIDDRLVPSFSSTSLTP
jgi:hypothetical protein